MQKAIYVAALLAATANLFWAANAIVGKVVVSSLPAFTLSQFRWLLAFAFLLPFGLPKIIQQWSWYRENLLRVVVLSILSVTLYNTLQYWALEYTEPVNVGAMLALMPLAIAVVSGLFGGRHLSAIEWLLFVVAVFGALLVTTNGQLMSLLSQQGGGVGELLMIAAILSWAAYSVVLKKTPHDNISMVGMLTAFVGIGTVFILPFWLFNIAEGAVYLPNTTQLPAIFFVALFPSIVSFFCWNQAVRIGDANIAGLMVTTAPLFNALLSIVFLQQQISLIRWVGIGIVVVAVAAALMISRRQMGLQR